MRKSGFIIRCMAMLLVSMFLCISVADVKVQAAHNKPIFTTEEQAYIATCDTVEVGCFSSYIPLSYRSGKNDDMQGIFPDYIHLLSDISGIDLKPIPMGDSKSSIDQVEKGEISLAAGVVASNEVIMDKKLQFTHILWNETVVAIKQSNVDFNTFDELTIAIPTSFAYAKYYLKANYKNYTLLELSNTEECLNAINTGKADVALRDAYMASYLLQKPIYADLVIEEALMIPEPVCIIAGTEVDSILIEILDKCILGITDAQDNEIVLKNTVALSYSYTMGDFIYRYQMWIVFLVVALVVVALAFYISIKQRTRILLTQKEKEVYRMMAECDKLTGVYNKDKFYQVAHTCLIENMDKNYDIVTIDIDRFKIVNDLFGLEEGDKLLCYIADEIKKRAEEGTIYGRISSDHFAILRCTDAGAIQPEADLVLLNYPLDMKISLSMGIYHVIDRGMPINLMCDRAFLAADSIKENYVQHIAVYDDSHRDRLVQEQEILNDTVKAFLNHEFVIYIQPKNSLETGEIVGGEALVRWIHPQKGKVAPNKFIPLFEKHGLIAQLDQLVLELTCRQLAEWKENGMKIVPISVNMSRMDFYNPNICEQVIDTVNKYHLDAQYIEFEVTESAYSSDMEVTYQVLKELQGHGFRILMDDFGSGYSSLNMLKDAPIDVLKLDLFFLSDSLETSRSRKIIEAIIHLAREIHMPVIAEGVENKEQLDFLQEVECECAQGYYFSRPIPCENFRKLLDRVV